MMNKTDQWSRLNKLSPTKRALLLKHIKDELATSQESQIPVRADRRAPFPLSDSQQRLWLFDQMVPGLPVYNISNATRLSGELDEGALERSLNEIVRRHETLRSGFSNSANGPVQIIAASVSLSLRRCNLEELAPATRAGAAQGWLTEQARQPFQLGQAPLLRVGLLRLGAEEHLLSVTMHHIITDGWSMGVFARELSALYGAYRQGLESPLEELGVQYADYAAWQQEWLSTAVVAGQLEYWREQLRELPVLEIPTERGRAGLQGYRGRHHEFALGARLTQSLREFSRAEGVTLYMTLLGGFEVLLSRYSGQEEVVVGTDVANRSRMEVEGLIGFFINLVTLRVDVSGDPSFRELVQRVREVCLGAYAHQDVPFQRVVEELGAGRELSRTPLFQVVFVLQNTGGGGVELSGLRAEAVGVETETTQFDLVVSLSESAERLEGWVGYNSDLWSAEWIARLWGHYERLLEEIIAQPDAKLSSLKLMAEDEMGLLNASNFPDAELSQRGFENLFKQITKTYA